MMEKIILLLGSPNNAKGELSQIAMDRISCTYKIYKSNDDIKLLCTGGFGEHFNVTNLPHAQYAKDALIEMGVHEDDFLPLVLSSNTYEDFEKAKAIIENNNADLLIVITSDFHIGRVRLLQKRIIDYPKTIFVPAKSSLSKSELLPLINHERNAVERLKQHK